MSVSYTDLRLSDMEWSIMKQSLVFSLLFLASSAVFADMPAEKNYSEEGLNLIYRTDTVTYAIDPQNAQLTDSGINLWLQTDFARPQPISNSADLQSRNLVRAEVDCLGHRFRFSQIRYYAASGDLVGGRDPKTEWLNPKDGSVGQSLIRQICITYVPTLHEQYVAKSHGDELPTQSLAQSTPPQSPVLAH